jgi:hypothetical protein
MVRALLIRGMLAGAIAGLLACAFAWLFGEPQIDVAIGFEQHSRMAAGEVPEPELVSRAVQSSMRHGATFLTAFSGVSLSFGVQGLLYVLFGMLFNYQIFKVLNISVPDALGTYGTVARKLFGIAITSIIVLTSVLFIALLMWVSMMAGGLIAMI